MTQLVWLRNDLRLQDNPALYQACAIGQPVRVIFCATPQQWQLHNESPRQLKLRESILANLTSELATMGICVDIIKSTLFKDLPKMLHEYCLQYRINTLWMNDQSWLNEQVRDNEITAVLTSINITVHYMADELLVNQPILTKEKTAYRVFTPWYKQWLLKLQSTSIQLLPAPCSGSFSPLKQWQKPVIPLASDFREDIFPPSEQCALSRLINFTHQGALDYAYHRDFPGINGTSLLSPYIAVGAISIRQCYVYLQQACLEQQAPVFENVWLKELAWREFYRYLMIHNTAIAKGESYNPHKEPNWLDTPEQFKAWQQGATGFPLIDAAMIQLKRTGWMHNRLRMLSASFLCKLLMIDWRKGEAHFMEHLIDGDFSSNNGGWQWSASVGCDAAPWFRIFNPTTQSKKFDSKGDFIRKMLPQLSELSDKDIHWPSNEQREKLNYALPIIDYASSRKRALSR